MDDMEDNESEDDSSLRQRDTSSDGQEDDSDDDDVNFDEQSDDDDDEGLQDDDEASFVDFQDVDGNNCRRQTAAGMARAKIRHDCERIAANDPQVTTLAVNRSVDEETLVKLRLAMMGNTNVVHLHVDLSLMSKQVEEELVQIMLSSKIKSLEFGHRTIMTTSLWPLCARTIHLLDTLSIQIDDDDHIVRLGEALTGNQSLHTLALSAIRMSPVGARALSLGLCNSVIRKLCVKNWIDDDEAMRELFLHGVQGCQTIENLTLENYFVRDWQALTSVIPKLCEFHIDYAEGVGVPSIENVHFLANGLRQSSTTLKRLSLDCWLGDNSMCVLFPILGNHNLSIEYLRVHGPFGDEAIISFVENWHVDSAIQELDLANSNVGSIGAQRLIRAVADHPKCCKLKLNSAVGYDGLKWIGEALPTTSLTELQFTSDDFPGWYSFAVVTREEEELDADQKCFKRAQASKALLDAVRHNFGLQQFRVNGIDLLPDVMAQVDLYATANRNGRSLLLQQHTLPFGLWSYFLAKQSQNNSLLFIFLLQLPTVLTSTHAQVWGTTSSIFHVHDKSTTDGK